MPLGFFRILRPGKRKVKYFTWDFCPVKYRKGFEKHRSLSFLVMNVANGPAERMFDCSHPWNAHGPIEFRHHG